MGSPVGQEVRLQLKPQLDCTVESERLLRPTLHMARQPQPRDDGCIWLHATCKQPDNHLSQAEANLLRHADWGLSPIQPPRSSRGATSLEAVRSTFGRPRIHKGTDSARHYHLPRTD